MKRTLLILILSITNIASFSQNICNIERTKKKVLNDIKSNEDIELIKEMTFHYTGDKDSDFETSYGYLLSPSKYRLFVYSSNNYNNDLEVIIKRYFYPKEEKQPAYFNETIDESNDTEVTTLDLDILEGDKYKTFLKFKEKREGCGFAILTILMK